MRTTYQESAASDYQFEWYERCKFSMAQILRSMDAVVAKNQTELRSKIHAAQTRLAEDRFNVAVVGRFSRGKSSLMNAMLRSERLPTGVEPLTSVITSVSYGTTEKVLIHHEGWAFPENTTIEELAGFVTQHGNPGNEKKVQLAEIRMPTELLREGFYFVDTPGLGSPILENTETTRGFLPEIDAMILVSGFDDPLDGEETAALDAAIQARRKAFVVLNKLDLVSEIERDRVCAEVAARIQSAYPENTPQVFALSALKGMKANSSGNVGDFASSGIQGFQKALAKFLLEHKSFLILQQMLERLREVQAGSKEVADDGEIEAAVDNLSTEVAGFSRIDGTGCATQSLWSNERPPLRGSCRVCYAMYKQARDFLAHYQYELLVRSETQQEHAAAGGFCPLHTWQYEAIASPQGISASQPPLVNRLADTLRTLDLGDLDNAARTVESSFANSETCPQCRVIHQAEDQTLSRVADGLQANDGSEATELCVQHIPAILRRLKSAEAAEQVVRRAALLLHRTAQDMARFAIKHEGTRRYLASDEEQKAYARALLLIAGPRTLAMAAQVRELGG